MVDPRDPDSVWLAIHRSEVGEVYHSTDGGLHWTARLKGLDEVLVHGLAFRDSTLLAATMDGVYEIFHGIFADGFEEGNLSAWIGSRTHRGQYIGRSDLGADAEER
ncbi:MAG: hypothetical protein MPN21_17890 [Thermoanaerobaculia bacterium]|nr:hypothetical protein [Thermoanaerobaculia bacterium]